MNDIMEITPFSRGLANLVRLMQGTPMAKKAADNIEINSYFACGTYTREMKMKKGSFSIGKIHRHSTVNILSEGTLMVKTAEGEFVYTAPATFVSGPGIQKAVYAKTDCTINNVHPWDGVMTLKELEHDLVVSDSEVLAFLELNPLKGAQQ